jgi:hypothetical protein
MRPNLGDDLIKVRCQEKMPISNIASASNP